MATVTLRLAPRPAHVRTARLVASAMARRGGVAEDLLDDIRLAVGEACARAVRLHERHGVDASVALELVDGDTFTVVVTDSVGVGADGEGVGLVASLAAGRYGTDGHVAGGWAPSPGAPGPAPAGSPAGLVDAPWVDERWADSERLGLAVLAGVVDDLRVESGSAGTRVHMRWPAGG